ncbi:hypothetical protein AAC387_Pa12g0684 [Persea americana]
MLPKSEFEKITGAKRRETREGSEKVGFRGKSGDPDPYGCRRPCTHGHRRPLGRKPSAMVAGAHGPRSPATMGHGRRRPWATVAGDHGVFAHFSVTVRSPFLGLFRFCFLLYFSLIFLLIYFLDSTKENPLRSRANQSTKFPIFGKAEDFVADFLPRVETRSNDVGMTWNLR